MDAIEENRLLRIDEVRRLPTFSQVHVYRLIKSGKFPRPVQIGVRRIGRRRKYSLGWLAPVTVRGFAKRLAQAVADREETQEVYRDEMLRIIDACRRPSERRLAVAA